MGDHKKKENLMYKRFVLIFGGVALLIGCAILAKHVYFTPIHEVVDYGDMTRVVYLLRDETIVDVSVTPSKECIHLDIHYDVLATRHVDIPTDVKLVYILSVRILATIHDDHFVDSMGRRWDWLGGYPLEGPALQKMPRGFLIHDREHPSIYFFLGRPGGPRMGPWVLRK